MRHEVNSFTFGDTSPSTLKTNAPAVSNGIRCDRFREKTVQILDADGLLAGLNADLEGTLDGNQWDPLITGIAGKGLVTVTSAVVSMRLNVKAIGAGNVAAMLAGFDSRTDGG